MRRTGALARNGQALFGRNGPASNAQIGHAQRVVLDEFAAQLQIVAHQSGKQRIGIGGVHGVSFDGNQVRFATGERLNALDPESRETSRALGVIADAATASFKGVESAERQEPSTGRKRRSNLMNERCRPH